MMSIKHHTTHWSLSPQRRAISALLNTNKKTWLREGRDPSGVYTMCGTVLQYTLLVLFLHDAAKKMWIPEPI